MFNGKRALNPHLELKTFQNLNRITDRSQLTMANCIMIENDFGVWSLDRLVTSYNLVLTCHNGSAIEDGFWLYKDKSQVTSHKL